MVKPESTSHINLVLVPTVLALKKIELSGRKKRKQQHGYIHFVVKRKSNDIHETIGSHTLNRKKVVPLKNIWKRDMVLFESSFICIWYIACHPQIF